MANLYDIKVQNELNDAERYLRLQEEEKALACLKRALELLYDLAKQATTEAQLRKYTDVINQVRPKYDELKAKYSIKEKQPIIVEGKQEKVENKEENKELKWFKTEGSKVKLEDVAGLEEVKEQIIRNVINPINYPEVYYLYNDKAGCNILMYGPPGCGKSFVSEAIVGEINCPYVYVTVTDILDKYVGEAPKKIKEIFEEAKQFDKCVIILDEIDSLCSSRDSSESAHTKDALNALLTCMSGFGTSSDTGRVQVFIAATNRPWALDSALTRGERLDTKIYVPLPDEGARRYLISKNFKKYPKLLENTDIDIEYIVQKTQNLAGADITSILKQCRSALSETAINNAKNGINEIVVLTKKIFDEVFNNYHSSIKVEDLVKFELYKNQK